MYSRPLNASRDLLVTRHTSADIFEFASVYVYRKFITKWKHQYTKQIMSLVYASAVFDLSQLKQSKTSDIIYILLG